MTSGAAQRARVQRVANTNTQPVRNRRDIIIYRDPFAYCSHASIVRLANGAWVVAFNEAQRVEPFKTIRTDYNHPPDDPHFHNLVTRSEDQGRTWTDPYMGGYTPRGVVQLEDGTVLMVTADHTLNQTAYAVRSQDGARSWSRPLAVGKAQEGGKLSEPTAVVLPGNRVFAMMRSNTGYLHQSESPDGGLTWTPVRRTPIQGSPGHLLLLSDGRLLVTYGHRWAPCGIRACLSQDGGRTWDYERELLIRDDMPNKNLGYPVSLEYEPGRLFTVYYGEQEGDGAREVAGYGVSSIRGSYWELS